MPPETETAATPPPPITDFLKWLGYHLTKDWRMMAKAPIAFLAVFVFTLIAAWLLTWKVVVPAMQVQLDTKQGIIEQKQSDIDSLNGQLGNANKDIEKLRASIPSGFVTQVVETVYSVTNVQIYTNIQLVSSVGPIDETRFCYEAIANTNLIDGNKIVLANDPIPQTVELVVNIGMWKRPLLLDNHASIHGNVITFTNTDGNIARNLSTWVTNGNVSVQYVKKLPNQSK